MRIPRPLMAIVASLFLLFGLACSGGPNTFDPCEGGGACVDGSEQDSPDNGSGTDGSTTDDYCATIVPVVTAACVSAGGTITGYCDEATDTYFYTCSTTSGGDIYITNENSSSSSSSSSNDGGSSDDEDPEAVIYACNDGEDNDEDGLIDFPEDPGCASENDDDETDAASEGDVDVMGRLYCDSVYSTTMATYFTTYGEPSEVVEQDNDFDGATDTVWISGTLEWDEINMLDLNADGTVDSSWACSAGLDGTPDADDNDGDGFSEEDGDWDDAAAGNSPVADEVCGDGFDNNSNGRMDESCETDDDSDTYADFDGDCNDGAATINPEGNEYTNLVDDDCDGTVDDASSVDSDGDGYCPSGTDTNGDGDCFDAGEEGTTLYDCNDATASIVPGAIEYAADGVDQDCDGADDT